MCDEIFNGRCHFECREKAEKRHIEGRSWDGFVTADNEGISREDA